jgi:hypothetical protein
LPPYLPASVQLFSPSGAEFSSLPEEVGPQALKEFEQQDSAVFKSFSFHLTVLKRLWRVEKVLKPEKLSLPVLRESCFFKNLLKSEPQDICPAACAHSHFYAQPQQLLDRESGQSSLQCHILCWLLGQSEVWPVLGRPVGTLMSTSRDACAR